MGLALRAIGQKHSASERELVAAVRQGDDRAFEELFARYRSRITAYVLGMVRDHARAEDITQEVFLSALRRLRDTERPIAFKPWIYEIARNACIDEFRRTKRTPEISLTTDDDSGTGERDLVSKQLTPDAAMENKQRLEALRGAFKGLSENHHRILVMRELEGRSYQEIATLLGMSRPMVESSLFRARRRLGEEFEALSSGQRCQQVCEVVDRADHNSIRVLGVRARRQVAQHLSYCDDCRRYARVAGADEALFRAPTFADKVAALFPFGWLARRIAGRLAHRGGFLARHTASASQYLDSLGPSALLGRVAAAVLVLAAAGGGYAGVNLGSGKPSAGKSVSSLQRAASVSSRPRAARAVTGARTRLPVAAGALAHRPAAHPAVAHAGAPTAPRHGAGPAAPGGGHGGGGGRTAGGALAVASSGAGAAPSTSSGATPHQLMSNGGVPNVVSKVVSPITSSLPSLPKPPGGKPLLRVPTAPTVNVPAPPPVQAPAPPPVQAPAPPPVVSKVGAVANGAVTTAQNTVSGLPSLGH